MKKTFFYIGCLALLVAGCNKVETEVTPVEEPAVESTRHLTVDINVEYPGDTRSLKTGWEEGDKIYVAFDHYFSDVLKPASGTSETVYYMTLIYTGNSWASEFSDDALEEYLLETGSGFLTAVYFSDLTPQFKYRYQNMGDAADAFALDCLNGMGAPGFYLTNNRIKGEDDAVNAYSVVDDKLKATLRMRIPDNMVHFFLEGVGPDDYQRFSLKCDVIAPAAVANINSLYVYGDWGEVYAGPNVSPWDWRDRYGEAIPAALRSDGIAFCGFLKNVTDQDGNVIETIVGQEAEYFIQVIDNKGTPDDSSDDIIHTLTKTATLNSKDAVKLPALDSGRWVDYEDAPIRFASDVVKEIAVNNWDTNEDGELSYAEAAAVMSLEGKFSNYNNPSIPRSTEFTFDELQYFTGLTSIGDHEFESTSMTSVILPPTIKSIGYSAFGDTKITSIVIPEGVTEFSHFVFTDTPLKSLHIPASLTFMLNSPVTHCANLSSITVSEDNPVYASPNGCNAIIVKATNTLFAGCSSTVIPETVTSIGGNAFIGAKNLKSIEIPGTVEEIRSFAFAYSGLQSVSIGNRVETIGNYAFYECDDLETVVIPQSVTSIGEKAFAGSGLQRVYDLAMTPQTFSTDMFGGYGDSYPIYVHTKRVEDYKSAWSQYASRIKGVDFSTGTSEGFSGFNNEISW